jgi:subtilisin family serine protease
VRVVNMSWGISAKDIEGLLEANGLGSSAQERQSMALESFGVLMSAMRAAMTSAPGILFVPAAGNSDEDVGFDVHMPASIDLPNVLTVGAVDQAGDETSFTSYGKRVRVYANGFEVESSIPGGERMLLSGTSMAAPNATNLAAKLFALSPKRTPEEVVGLILEGASPSEDGRRKLIDSRRSVELLRSRDQR